MPSDLKAAEPHVGQVLFSNNGRGPLLAEITGIYSDGSVKLERWDRRSKSKYRTPFSLSMEYLRSTACGWKPTTEHSDAR